MGERELEPPEIREGDGEWEKVFCHLVRSNYTITGISVLCILLRREFILEKDLFFDEGYLYYTDLPYIVRAMCRTERGREVPRVLYMKRKHSDLVHLPSLSQVRDDTTKRLEAVKAYLGIKEMIRGRDERVEISLDDKFIRYYVKRIALFRRACHALFQTTHPLFQKAWTGRNCPEGAEAQLIQDPFPGAPRPGCMQEIFVPQAVGEAADKRKYGDL